MQISNLPVEVQQKIKSATVPIVYADAVRAVIACQTIDDAKYFDNAADALAAYAKIHRDKTLELESKRLKLHAYRKMGELAEQLRPTVASRKEKGARSILVEEGLSSQQAKQALRLSRLTDDEFVEIERKAQSVEKSGKDAIGRGVRKVYTVGAFYRIFSSSGTSPMGLRGWCRRFPAAELAKGCLPDEAVKAREIMVEIQEWFDEFEQNLPKEKK